MTATQTFMLWQPTLPDRYTTMSEDDLVNDIAARKKQLGNELVILGHHYQQDDVIRFADFTGDSFKLSQLAARKVEETGAKYVVFLGVHFMAESADILTPEGTTVILPDLGAGCSMADMASYEQALEAWDELHDLLTGARTSARTTNAHTSVRLIPICYMNCSAAIKAFCGRNGGAVCTSSNADRVLEWALAGGTQPKRDGEEIKILFLPDQHLGRNTAKAMGYSVDNDMCVWDPKAIEGLGGNDEDTLQRSTFILWKGHCSVHKLFRPEHVDDIREQWPDVNVMVHPECDHTVVDKADFSGSTEGILNTVRAAAPGSRWAIGTEVHMVNRLAQEMKAKDVTVRILSDCQCLCTTMYRIDTPHLLWVLDNLADGKVVNQITVHPEVQELAIVALNRMLELIGHGNIAKVSD